MVGYLCKSLRIISLVWPTRLAFLAMGEVLSIGFDFAVCLLRPMNCGFMIKSIYE